jgi:hypothetical protein
MSKIRKFMRSLSRASAGPQPTNTGNPQKTGSSQAPQTDDSGLFCNDTVHVSKDGIDEGHPKPDVEYDINAEFGNRGKRPSGPCFVRFTLSEDMDWQDDYDLDDGLKPGASVRAIVNFGPFPNQSANYRLKACIFSKGAPDQPIACAGEFGFPITKS